MKLAMTLKAVLLATAFVAGTLQGSRLPENLEWDAAKLANAFGSDRVCTLADERAGRCAADRMWA